MTDRAFSSEPPSTNPVGLAKLGSLWSRFKRVPGLVMFAVGWIALMIMVAILADVLSPYAYTALDLRNRLSPPGTPGHWLGTDELGRDVLSRLIHSIRMSLLIAFGATLISAALGTTLGFLAAYFRGVVEQLVLMLADFQASMPFLILALSVLAFFGNSIPLLICLMGLVGWDRYARIARGLAISASAQGYAAAVRQLGATPSRTYLRHILPNIASTLIVSMTLVFPEVILLESGLSFLPRRAWATWSASGESISAARRGSCWLQRWRSSSPRWRSPSLATGCATSSIPR
jgi:peptide/nickel transport system permease protein